MLVKFLQTTEAYVGGDENIEDELIVFKKVPNCRDTRSLAKVLANFDRMEYKVVVEGNGHAEWAIL